MSEYKIIGAIGDSITQGFCDEEGLGWFGRFIQKLSLKYPNKYGFNNVSKFGDRVCDSYHRLASQGATNATDILILAVGINDLTRRGSSKSPIDMSEALRIKYWEQIFDLSKKLNLKVIVLDILPVIEEEDDEKADSKYNFNTDIEKYNEIIKAMCKERNIPFIERYQNWINRNLKELYVDTVHPNSKAHEILANEIFNEFEKIEIL